MTDQTPDPVPDDPVSVAFVVAHLSDPHMPLGRPRLAEALGKRGLSWLNWLRKRRHLHLPRITGQIVADLQAAGPDFIAMTGDLVNFSLEAEFAAGAKWLAALGPPDRVGVVPGNHEAMAKGFEDRLLRHWAPYITGDDGRPGFPWLRRRGPLALIGVSTAAVTPPGMAAGHVGAAQAEALARLLAETGAEGLCRVVLIHHPPTDVTKWRKALRDRALVAEAIRAEGAELVLHGHTHRADLSWIDTPRGRVPVLGTPACGMAPGPGRDAGAWRRLAFTREAGEWRLDLRERRVNAQGALEDGPHLTMALPVTAVVGGAGTQ